MTEAEKPPISGWEELPNRLRAVADWYDEADAESRARFRVSWAIDGVHWSSLTEAHHIRRFADYLETRGNA